MIAEARKDLRRYGKNVGLRDRICCYQWTRFTMATGGISNVLHFHKYLSNLPLVSNSAAIILINICEYGIPRSGLWLQRVVELMFWVYIGASYAASAAMYLIIWSTQIFPIHIMTPVSVFPAYTLLLAAPFASNLISDVTQADTDTVINTLTIAFCTVTVQGTGFLISFMLPQDMQRPGVFISSGPSGVTAAGIIVLGTQISLILPVDYEGRHHAIVIVQLFWFLLVSVDDMVFFALPNTALVAATIALANILDNTGLKIFGCVMATALILVWLWFLGV
ncbi:uncharacterized protein BCR38DRAFT_457966 [Pseudomassariella vexata]|uniref:Uncharacterized protein n=1 Tax=Pseudomassariella vexata TaxID=1141098 RepID=A0A1Y2DY90_9PEZI|nr:uncharacterized protein BCR38DRAFT_457966 [Pseudomassariella vexata]ORY64207.1 hypothetical protein BCR38DRAFT_457966 [Pseudomassariella vexata]